MRGVYVCAYEYIRESIYTYINIYNYVNHVNILFLKYCK